MAFSLPVFNLHVDVWAPGFSPGMANPPNWASVPCQLYGLSRASGTPTYQLRLDSTFAGLTIVTGTNPPLGSATGFQLVEFPASFWAAIGNPIVMHAGFANEYWAVQLISSDNLFNGNTGYHLPI